MDPRGLQAPSTFPLQPFLPITPAKSVSPIFVVGLAPFSALHAIARVILLGIDALLYLVLTQMICLVFVPVPPLHRNIKYACTALTCRLALCLMGYWWIETEMASQKRGAKGVSQISNLSPRRGDLIISSWTSYIDVLYLAFRHDPTFLLPVFSSLPDTPKTTFGRHTGTGSASIATNIPQHPLLGYVRISLSALLARTGSLPETYITPPKGMYKSLRNARKKEMGPVVVFPEGTTGNGRALLRFGEGTLSENDVGGEQDGIVWVKYIKHSAPTPFAASAICPTPTPMRHLLSFFWTPGPVPPRSMTVRTLHPSGSPSSPSFLPSEILANTPGGLDSAGKDGKGAWREACATVLAETGRVKRVRGMGWEEKKGFLEYWKSARRR